MKYLVIASLLLGGCASAPNLIPVVVSRPAPTFPQAQPASQYPYEWIVITRENFEQRMSELEATDGDFVVFAVTPEGYQNLNMNQAELRRYIEQQSVVVEGYQEYLNEQSHSPRRPVFRIITTPQD